LSRHFRNVESQLVLLALLAALPFLVQAADPKPTASASESVGSLKPSSQELPIRPSLDTFESQRSLALLIGAEAAMGLLKAKMGKDMDDHLGALNSLVRQIGFADVVYPKDALGPDNTGAPTMSVTAEIARRLARKDERLKSAVMLGTLGVIQLSGGEKNEGYDIRTLALKAGFPPSKIEADDEYLDELVADAKDQLAGRKK
jgi:hypothetical protein